VLPGQTLAWRAASARKQQAISSVLASSGRRGKKRKKNVRVQLLLSAGRAIERLLTIVLSRSVLFLALSGERVFPASSIYSKLEKATHRKFGVALGDLLRAQGIRLRDVHPVRPDHARARRGVRLARGLARATTRVPPCLVRDLASHFYMAAQSSCPRAQRRQNTLCRMDNATRKSRSTMTSGSPNGRGGSCSSFVAGC